MDAPRHTARTVAVAGARGFIGTGLTAVLEAAGERVLRIGRGGAVDVEWDPARGKLDPHALEGVHAVVNLAGEPIDQRWTADARRRIIESRVQSTGLLARTLAEMSSGPRVFVSMSAIGIYGDRGDDVLDERSPPGEGFLADVVREWEAAAEPARAAGLRVIHPRTGVVLHPSGGALERMLPFFRLGVGGPIAGGRQWISWISYADAVRGLAWLALDSTLNGVVNLTAPEPVRGAEFARALGRAIHRPAVLPTPAFAIKALYGRMGEETVVQGQRVLPRRLLDAGFEFAHRTIDHALADAFQPVAS
ncbi:MAG TPA: TIGR01777 family oxidoreductase [Gemmatimonadaceae bacterium]